MASLGSAVVPDVWHHFHYMWVASLTNAVEAALPEGYYAMAEQHLSRKSGDVLTLLPDETEPERRFTRVLAP